MEEVRPVIVERRRRKRWNHLDALQIHASHERWSGPYEAYAAQAQPKRVSEAPSPADAKSY